MKRSYKKRPSLNLCLLTMALALVVNTGCNKQLDVQSTRQASEEGQWTRFEDARSGLMGLYGLFRASIADNNGHWIWGELRNGDFTSVFRPDLNAVIEGNLNASFPLVQNVANWRRFYATINACNLFIERVSGCLADKRYTENYLKLDVAQARALRAFAYFYLVRIWGDVPLITASSEGSFEALPQTDKDVILSFASQELVEIGPRLPFLYSGLDPEQLFPNNYYGNNQSYWLNAPISKLAAYAMLAHISAWQGRYLDVAVYTEFIQNNFSKSNITMVTTDQLVNTLFLAGNNNFNQLVGFSFIKPRGETSSSGHFEQLTLANTSAFPMSKQLPDIYVPKDSISNIFLKKGDRYDQRFGTDTSTPANLPFSAYFENYSSAVPVFKKIRVIDGGVNEGKYAVYNSSIVFTRLEEIRLLRAEALAVLGQTNLAVGQLNLVRGNRGVKPITAGPNTDLLTEIFDERRRELMGEGWRWYDLVRYNRLKRNNPAFNELLDNNGIYWPIAQEVLNRNPKLIQNSYWR